MFARKLRIEIDENGARRPCPLAWLDQYFMRHFTGHAAFEETLPVADGVLEAGLKVNAEALAEHFEAWLRGRKMIAGNALLHVREERPPAAIMPES
jgi:hypothetical protein